MDGLEAPVGPGHCGLPETLSSPSPQRFTIGTRAPFGSPLGQPRRGTPTIHDMNWRKNQNRLSFLVILGVVLAWFSPWWAAGRFLAPLDLQNRMMSPWNAAGSDGYAKNHFVSDGVDQYLVYRIIAERDLRLEGRVGWSSLTYGGTPQYANTMALYSDWTMQLHRWFDFKTAWHLGLMGQALIAAYGMFFFLRGREITAIWAVCGALLWAANSQFVTWIYHRWALGSFCWVPWILWSIDRARAGKTWAALLIPMFLAASFLGGTLQHSALVVIVVAAAWLEGVQGFRSLAARCEIRCAMIRALAVNYVRRCIRSGSRQRFICSDAHRAPLQASALAELPWWRFAVWGLLGVGLATFMFLPCVAAYLESNRLGLHIGSHGYAPGWYPQGKLQPIFNLASYPLHVFPSLLGRCDSLDVLKLFKSELFYVAFFGTLPMIGAFIAMWRRATPLLAKILIVAGLLLPLTPLVRLLYQRLLLLFILGGILAFVHFMNTATRETKATAAKCLAMLMALSTIVWTGASLWIRRPVIDSFLRERIASAADGGGTFGFYQEWVFLRINRFVDGLTIWHPTHSIPLLLLSAGLIGLWFCASASSPRRRVGAMLLAASAIADVTIFASRWVTWSELPLFAETSETRALRQHVGSQGRITTVIHPSAHMAKTPFIPNTLAAYDIATISGYDSIIPDGMILPNESPADAGRLGRLGVSHLVTWAGNDEVQTPWRKIWSSPMMDLHENPLAVPHYAGFENTKERNDFLAGTSRRMTPLVEKLGLENERTIVVPAGVRWIRIAENHAPGWRYRFHPESTWSDVTRAPDASMLIESPDPGVTARIEMRYDPPLRRIGFAVSGASMIILLGIQCWGLRYRGGALQAPRSNTIS